VIGWRQTLTTSPPNHIHFSLVRAKKIAKRKLGFKNAIIAIPGFLNPNFNLVLDTARTKR
jgi:hypothetical protein